MSESRHDSNDIRHDAFIEPHKNGHTAVFRFKHGFLFVGKSEFLSCRLIHLRNAQTVLQLVLRNGSVRIRRNAGAWIACRRVYISMKSDFGKRRFGLFAVKRHEIERWNGKIMESFLICVTAFKIFFEIRMQGVGTHFKQGRNIVHA